MKTVLIVDDECVVRSILEEMITFYHPEAVIIHAKNGAHAWEIINSPENGRIDLMISDVEMPVMTGTQLVEKVRKNFPDVHVILMSGGKEPDAHSAHAFIFKPFGMADMIEIIKSLMIKKAGF